MVYQRQYYNREYETRAASPPVRRHSPPQSRPRNMNMPSSTNSPTSYRKDYSRSQHYIQQDMVANNSTDRRRQQQQEQQEEEQHQHQHQHQHQQDQYNCSINTNLSYESALQPQSMNDRNTTTSNVHASVNANVNPHTSISAPVPAPAPAPGPAKKAMSDINYSHGRSNFGANGDGGSPNSVIGLNVKDLASRYGSTSSSSPLSSSQRSRRSRSQSRIRNQNHNPNDNSNNIDHSVSVAIVGMKNKSIYSNGNTNSLYQSRFQHSPTRRFVDNAESEHRNNNGVAIGNSGEAGEAGKAGGDESGLDGVNMNDNNNDNNNNDNILSEKNQVGSADHHVHRRGAVGRNVQQFQQRAQDNNFKRVIGTSSTSTNTKTSQQYVQYGQWNLSLGKNTQSNIRNDHRRPHEILEATNNDDDDDDDDNNKNSEKYNYNSNNQESSSDPSTAAASNSRRTVQNHFPSSGLRSRSRSRSRSRLTAHDNITNGKTMSKNIYGKKQNRNESITREAPPSQQSNQNRITNGNKHNLDERNGDEEVYRANVTRNFGTRKQLHRPYPVGLNTPTTSKEEAIIDTTEQKNLEDDDHSNDKSNHSSSRNSNGNHSDASRAVTDSAENKSVLEKAHFWRHQLSNQRSRSSTASSSAIRRISTPSRVNKNNKPAVETPGPSEQQEEPQPQPQSFDNNSKNPNQGRIKQGHLPTPSAKTPISSTKEASSEQKRRNDFAKSSLPTNASSNIFFNRHLQYMQQKSRAQRQDTEALQTRSKAHEEATSPQESLPDRVSENRQNLRSSLMQNAKNDGLRNKDAPEAANAMQPSARTFGHDRQLKASKVSYSRGESKQSQTGNRGKNVPVISLTSGSHEDDQKLTAKESEIRQNDSYDTSSSHSQRKKSFGSHEPMHSFARAKSQIEKMGKKATPVLTEDEQKYLRNKTQSDHRAEITSSTSTSTNRHVLQRGKEVSHPTSENHPRKITEAVTMNNRNVSSLRNDETPSTNLLSLRSSQEEKNYVHTRSRTNSQTKDQTSLAKVKKPAITPSRSTSRGKINEGLQNNQNDAITQSDAKEENQKPETTKINTSKFSPQISVRDQGPDKRPRSRNRKDMMQSLQSMRNNTKSLNDIVETPTATPPRQTIDNFIEGQSKSPMSVSPSRKSLHERIRKFNTGGDAPLPPQYKTEKVQYRELNAEVQESDSETKVNAPTKEEQGSVKEGGGILQVSSIPESQEAFDSVKSDSLQEFGENSTVADYSLSLSVSEAKKRLWDTNERLQTCHRGQKLTVDSSADTTIDLSDGDTTMFKSKFVRAAEVSQSSIRKTNSTESQQSSYQYSGKSFGRSVNSAQNSDKIKKSAGETKKQQNSKEIENATEDIASKDFPRPSNPQSGSNHNKIVEKRLNPWQQVKQTVKNKTRMDGKAPPLNHRGSGHQNENHTNHHRRRGKTNYASNKTHTMNNNSVAKLVAKLTSVKRDDPSAALRMIDSILKSESRELGMIEEDDKASEQEKGKCSKAFQDTLQDLKSNDFVNKQHQEETMSEKDDSDSCDSDSDESTVSAITDPTYQSGFGDTSSIISYSTISRHGKKRQFSYHIPRDGGPSPLRHPYSSSRAPRNRKSIAHSSTQIQQGVKQESNDLNISRESDGHDTSATMASPPIVRRLQSDSNSKSPSPNSPSKKVRGGTSTHNKGLLNTINTWDENSDESINASLNDELSKKQPSSPTCSERIKRMSASQSLSPSDRIKRLAQTVVGNCEDVAHDPQAKRFLYPHIQDKNNSGEEISQEDNHFLPEQQYYSHNDGEEHEHSPSASREAELPENIASAFDDVNVSFGSQNIFSSKAKGTLSFLSPLAKKFSKVEKMYSNHDA